MIFVFFVFFVFFCGSYHGGEDLLRLTLDDSYNLFKGTVQRFGIDLIVSASDLCLANDILIVCLISCGDENDVTVIYLVPIGIVTIGLIGTLLPEYVDSVYSALLVLLNYGNVGYQLLDLSVGLLDFNLGLLYLDRKSVV